MTLVQGSLKGRTDDLSPSTMKVIGLFLMVLTTQAMVVMSSDEGDYGLDAFNYLIAEDPKSFCHYIRCVQNISPEDCPQDTVYTEGVAQFGCCGACVRFKKVTEQYCTGSIDSGSDGHYNTEELANEALRNSIILTTGSAQPDSTGLPPNSNLIESSWCSYGLDCDDIRFPPTCRYKSTASNCLAVQEAYDYAVAHPEPDPVNHTTSDDYIFYRDDYRWRPNCTANGEYEPMQCKGPRGDQRCICVDPTGNTLFGSAFTFQPELYNNMNCKCSREMWERITAGDFSATLHCYQNGNYEPMQCDKGWCYCVDPDTGVPYSTTLPEKSWNLLPCYNFTTAGQQYLRRCESELHAHIILSELLRDKNVLPPSTSRTCDNDGSYGPVQYDGYQFKCHNRYNEPYSRAADFGCQCVRDKEMFEEGHIAIVVSCDGNYGKYIEKQLLGETAFCVDTEGVRSGPLVYKEFDENLDCALAANCQNGHRESCKYSCTNCPLTAYYKYSPS